MLELNGSHYCCPIIPPSLSTNEENFGQMEIGNNVGIVTKDVGRNMRNQQCWNCESFPFILMTMIRIKR